jgi:hypothetical protein
MDCTLGPQLGSAAIASKTSASVTPLVSEAASATRQSVPLVQAWRKRHEPSLPSTAFFCRLPIRASATHAMGAMMREVDAEGSRAERRLEKRQSPLGLRNR